MSEEFRARAAKATLVEPIAPAENHLELSVADWIKYQAEAERYWFQRIELFPGYYSPGWDDPAENKLPHYGLPKDLTGMRVLDIGCAEGFFSFEAERRGAREVIGIDSFVDSVRRFNIVKQARQSNANAFLMNVYDLEPKRLGTFDLVLFYGVFDDPALKDTPYGRFYPHGMPSGPNNENFDVTVFWLFNGTCCSAMLDHVGFTDLEVVSNTPYPFVMRARSPEVSPGTPPDQTESPWS